MQDVTGWQNQQGTLQNNESAQELQKALQVGFPNTPGAAGGQALTRQSLDAVLATTTLSMADIKLWKMLPKVAANSTVEQYVELAAYGQNIENGFMAEIDTPNNSDATYVPRYELLKTLGVRCGVSFIAMQTKNIVDLAAEAARTGTMDLLRKTERSLWYGDPTKSPLQWQGLIPKILARSPAANIIDCRGLPLDQEFLLQGTTVIADAPNYGVATHLFVNTRAKGDIARGFLNTQRTVVTQGNNSDAITIGLNPTQFASTSGMVQFVDTPFLDNGGNPTLGAVGDPSLAPPVPVISTAALAGAPGAGVESKFTAADAGAYTYVVQASNSNGFSAPIALSAAAIQVAAGQVVTFGITAGAGNVTEHFKLYRTPLAGGAPVLIQKISNLDANNIPQAGVQVLALDYNDKLPGSYDAVMMQFDVETVRFLQLGSLTRVPLAIVQTAMQWMLLMTGAPSLRAPNRAVLFKNVGLAQHVASPY